MIIRKNYNKENKNEVRGGEEEGCLGIKNNISWINIFIIVAVSEVGFFMNIYLSLTICP